MFNLGMEAKVPRKAAALAVVVGLGLSACSGEDTSVKDQLGDLYKDASELCDTNARTETEAKYPNAKVGETPTLEELQQAVEIQEAKETKGAAYFADAYKKCMDANYFGVVEVLEVNDMTPPTNSVTESTVTPSTEV